MSGYIVSSSVFLPMIVLIVVRYLSDSTSLLFKKLLELLYSFLRAGGAVYRV